MKKIQDLQSHEAIEIRTNKEAKKINKIAGIDFAKVGYLSCLVKGHYCWTNSVKTDIELIYSASEFLKPTKKDLLKRIEALENQMFAITAEKMINKAIDDVKKQYKETKPEVGKWYNVGFNDERGVFGLIHVTEIKHGMVHHYGFHFDRHKSWTDKDWISDDLNYTPATDEEVKQALIVEAERRGFKNADLAIFEAWDNTLYIETIDFGKTILFDNGKWVEIFEQPKEIDWNLRGQKVILMSNGDVIMVTGEGSNESNFSGVVIKSVNNPFGRYSDAWYKDLFKPYNEPITL